MALNLVEASKIALGRDEVLKASLMELYARNSEIVAILPFETISGNALSFNREKTLPGAGFRGINEGYTESTGTVERVTESLAIAGGDLDVDKFLIDTAGADQRSIQEALKVKSLSLSLGKTFVKGDVISAPKSFNGLQVRLTGNNLLAAGATSSGDALSLAKLDQLIDNVEDPTHLVMNKAMRRRLTSAARDTAVGGFITYTTDIWGRQVTKYNDLPIICLDKDETNSDILPFTEVCPGGGSNLGVSVYCLSVGSDGVVGLQNGDMNVRDLGELEAKPVFRTRIEWYVTLALMRPRCATRLWGVKDAAVTV
jgi:hypothetical protein